VVDLLFFYENINLSFNSLSGALYMDIVAVFGVLIAIAALTYRFIQRHKQKSYEFEINRYVSAHGGPRKFTIEVLLSNKSENTIMLKEARAHLEASAGNIRVPMQSISTSLPNLCIGERKKIGLSFKCGAAEHRDIKCDRFKVEIQSRHSSKWVSIEGDIEN